MEAIWTATISRKNRLLRTFLVKADSLQEATRKFSELEEKEIKAGEPILTGDMDLSFEPVEWESDIIEI